MAYAACAAGTACYSALGIVSATYRTRGSRRRALCGLPCAAANGGLYCRNGGSPSLRPSSRGLAWGWDTQQHVARALAVTSRLGAVASSLEGAATDNPEEEDVVLVESEDEDGSVARITFGTAAEVDVYELEGRVAGHLSHEPRLKIVFPSKFVPRVAPRLF